MITYHYHCTNCEAQFTIMRSIRDPILTDCTKCNTSSLQTIFHAVPIVDNTPRTLGAQADYNYKKAGCYERQDRQQEIVQNKNRAVQAHREETQSPHPQLPSGMTSIRKPKPDPVWWRPNKSEPEPALVRGGAEVQKKYLETGKV